MTEPYPLEQILEVKKKRVEEAEKVVAAKQETVHKEEKKLQETELGRDKVQKLYQEKLSLLRKEMDEGTNATTIRKRREHLKLVKEDLTKEERKVEVQKKVTDAARKELEEARKVLKIKLKESEKLNIHQEEWSKEATKTAQRAEEKDLDETGTIIYYGKKYKK